MESDVPVCVYCLRELNGTFIKCMDCSRVVLCLSCFCSGVEAGAHKRTHGYQIKTTCQTSIPVFGGWDAREELKLLEALEQYGVGNWEDISLKVETKSSKQCLSHYWDYYLGGIIGYELSSNDKHLSRITDHTNLSKSFSPQFSPSPAVHIDVEDQQLLGYTPARDDFERDYDNDAESILCRLNPSFSQDDLEDALKVAQVGIYVQRLRERQRRKEIAREHGLIAQILAFILNKKIKRRIPLYHHKPQLNTSGCKKRTLHNSPRKHYHQSKLTSRNGLSVESSTHSPASSELRPIQPPPGSWLAAPFVLQASGATRGTPLVESGLSNNPCPLAYPGSTNKHHIERNNRSTTASSKSFCSPTASHTVFYLNEKLKPFLRYFTGLQGKEFMDSLFREETLKHEIKYLIDHRAKGLKVKFHDGKLRFPYFRSSIYNAPQRGLTTLSSHLSNTPVKIRKRRRHPNTPWYIKVQRRAKHHHVP
ncbi:unnamed protein product [Calicophoron daubneyi]|uniref:Transcriptional adapter 2-beta n=1 Tax=Calicophoron daubneyi TaxID=300641 RepID=A0AAV2TAC6_CALDB